MTPTKVFAKTKERRIAVEPERVEDPKRPGAFVYKALIKNSIPVESRYGREAERDLQLLGTSAERDAAGQTATELIKSIAHIQSLQRMRAIRKMVYEAAEVTTVVERVKADSEASKYNALYTAAYTVRCVDDIAFSAWWYALLGSKASCSPC